MLIYIATMKIKIEKDPTKVKRGHQAHRSGSGEHQDRRDRRNRTRQSQKNNAIKEYNT